MNNEGILLSPNYPMNYDNNHECIYSIQVTNLFILAGAFGTRSLLKSLEVGIYLLVVYVLTSVERSCLWLFVCMGVCVCLCVSRWLISLVFAELVDRSMHNESSWLCVSNLGLITCLCCHRDCEWAEEGQFIDFQLQFSLEGSNLKKTSTECTFLFGQYI